MRQDFRCWSAVGVFALACTSVVGADAQTPPGWGPRVAPAGYEFKVDFDEPHKGRASCSIKARTPRSAGVRVALSQMFSAKPYRGKRVRMRGFVRTNAADGAGLWMRVDTWMEDVMRSRRVKGTTQWTEYQLVLDIPERANSIAFGVVMDGRGQVWADDFTFEVVDNSVRPTGSEIARAAKQRIRIPTDVPDQPSNVGCDD